MLWKPRISTLADDARSSRLVIASLVKGHFTSMIPRNITAQIETASRIQRNLCAGAFVVVFFSGSAISVGTLSIGCRICERIEQRLCFLGNSFCNFVLLEIFWLLLSRSARRMTLGVNSRQSDETLGTVAALDT